MTGRELRSTVKLADDAHIKEEKADSTDNETNLKENRC